MCSSMVYLSSHCTPGFGIGELSASGPDWRKVGGKCDLIPEFNMDYTDLSKGQYFSPSPICVQALERGGEGFIRWWCVLGLVRFLLSRQSCLLSFPSWSESKKKQKPDLTWEAVVMNFLAIANIHYGKRIVQKLSTEEIANYRSLSK